MNCHLLPKVDIFADLPITCFPQEDNNPHETALSIMGDYDIYSINIC